MSKQNNWYVITGGPSTGKTTLLEAFEKLGHKTIPEAARTVIDESLAKGITADILRADERDFQNKVAKLKAEIETSAPTDVLTFFDRGMHDTLAYMRYYDFKRPQWVDDLMKKSKYHKVFLLEPLGAFEQDYARTEDARFSREIQQLLYDAYAEFGMKPVVVPSLGVEDRIKFILNLVPADMVNLTT